ncbi:MULTISPECIES: hypothetical protein [unclassified Caballeronia]|uniref:hypothetical protein n=1 Tax=unclassified Caballeronia TaxID=2646786 RepID=UPI00285CE410|nr:MULTISPECIES: hypothetical protein [unclassified Caballeronia]MDR5738967.1 hypothetical protein [Caballeronia sp. LZ016]MDR5807455.1 hypothetical protein [Caballeronia sp. LZ019]
MPVRLVRSEIAWNQSKNEGLVVLQFQSGQRTGLRVSSLAELAGWAAIISSDQVFGTEDGWVVGLDGSGAVRTEGTEVPFPVAVVVPEADFHLL